MRRLPAPLLAALLTACAADPASKPDGAGEGGDTAAGCALRGQAKAAVLTEPEPALPGPLAVGAAGDLLLQNEHAAFVITAPGSDKTYYYYGGVVADAAPMDGCDFAGDDKLDEIAPVLGTLNLTDLAASTLRGFRGTRATVLRDGSDGGAAVVRVEGTDDTHWLVEYELIGQKIAEGGKAPSAPWGLALQIDHILEPGSRVLRSEWTFTNTTNAPLELLAAHLLSFGPSLDVVRYADTQLSFGGFALSAGIPYLVAADGEGAYAFTVEQGNLAYVPISGIDVALDLNQALSAPIALPPGASATRTTFFAVSPTDGAPATAALTALNPTLVPGKNATPATVRARVQGPDGAPVEHARVELLAGDDAQVMDLGWTDATGAADLNLPSFTPAWSYGLRVIADGREPLRIDAPSAGAVDLRLPAPAALRLQVSENGAPVPARVALRRDDGWRHTLWTDGDDTLPLRPGAYVATVSRGYEYAPVVVNLELGEGETGALSAELRRVVDTAGWISADTHTHSEQSPDSRTPVTVQLLHAAAHGLEVMLHTEHEHIIDAYSGLDPALRRHVASLIGQEVTATMPEHMTMLPVAPDGSPRGGFVAWYGMDLERLFAAMRARAPGGATIFNHPGYMWRVDWDVLAASPRITDPAALGLGPDRSTWSWDFDGMEVMNGLSDPFASGNGRFLLWQSALHAGHPITAVASSDDHSGEEMGFPRTYLPVERDDPADFEQADLVDAVLDGTATLSAGAFARVSVGGAGPGALVRAEGGALSLDIEVQAIPEIDVSHVVVFANCAVVAREAAQDRAGVIKLQAALPLRFTEDSTLVVAAFGEGTFPDGLPTPSAGAPRALTNAIYIDADGDGAWTPPGGRACEADLSAPSSAP